MKRWPHLGLKMPLIKQDKYEYQRFIPSTEQEKAEDGPSAFDVVGSAFAQENTFVNWAANGFEINKQFEPVKDYNPFDGDIEGYELYADSFIESRSPEETNYLKSKIDDEAYRRQVVSDGGGIGFTSTIAAGLLDPIYWPTYLVGLGQVRTAKSAGQAFAATAATGAATEIPAELVKQQLQETRTFEESAISVGGAALIGGLLGAGLNKMARGAPEVKIDEKALLDKVESQMNRSMGAAEVSKIDYEDLTVAGAAGLEKLPVSPLIRAMGSEDETVRRVTSSMMESPVVVKGNVKGVTAVPEGGSVETRINSWNKNLYDALQGTREAYKKYSKRVSKKMSYSDFRNHVGKSMRRNDEHDIPEIAEAAQNARRTLIDPLKDAAIDAQLFKPDVKTTTAPSYFTRAYQFKKIIAQRPQWNTVVDDWLKGIRSSAQRKLDELTASGKEPSASLKGEAGITDAEIAEVRNQITNKILGTSTGRIPYDMKIAVRGPLKERTFNIPDERIEDFLDSDTDVVFRQYAMTMSPDVELTRMFGSVDLSDEVESIVNSYTEKMNGAKTEKARKKLESRMREDIRDVEAMRDRLRGTYGMPSDPDSFFVKAGRTMRDFNFMTLLGGMTLSAIPDLARLVAVNGFKPLSKGLYGLASSPKKFKLAREEAKKAAVGLDMVLNSRAMSLSDLTDAYQRGSQFERGMQKATDTFSKMTLMQQWNAGLKQFSGVITSDRLVSESIKWASGDILSSVKKRMAVSGIDQDMAKRIADQFAKYGDDGDLKLINGDNWDDIGALETFRNAVLKDANRTIMEVGAGEKPLWTSNEMGKLIFQFKSFAAAAHHKILLADVQYRDAAALNGIIMATALGSVAYGAKQFAAGKDISTNPNQVLVESLDRSGAWGYFWDVNNISAKMTNGELSINTILGADPVSRYASRNIIGAMLGPSVGLVEDVRQVTGSISDDGQLTDSDVNRLRRMMPGQNLFYIRRLLNALVEE